MPKIRFSLYQGFRLATWINSFAVLINSLGYMVTGFLALYLHTQLHFSMQQVGFIIGSQAIGMMAGSYLGGHYSDKILPYYIVCMALSVTALTLWLVPIITQYNLFLVLFLVNGIALGAFRPVNMIMLFSGYERSWYLKVNALYRMAQNLGIGISGMIGALLVLWNYAAVFIFSGTMALLALCLLIRFRALFIAHKETESKSEATTSVMTILRHKPFVLVCSANLLLFTIFCQTRSTYPVYLYAYYHIKPTFLSLVFSLNCFIIVLGELPILAYFSNRNPIVVAMAGAVTMALSMMILPYGHSGGVVILSCVLWTLGEILGISVFFSLARTYAPVNHVGKSMGIFHVTLALAAFTAPILGGWAYPYAEARYLWVGCGILGMITLGLLFWLYSDQKKQNFKEKSLTLVN